MNEQPNPEPAAPCGSDAASSETVTCRRGHVSPPGSQRCTTCGVFALRNALKVTHGLRAQVARRADLDLMREQVDAIVDAYLADEPVDIPARRKSQIQNRAILQGKILLLNGALDVHGVADCHGKLRQVWLQMLCTLIDRARAIDSLLSLRRTADDPFACTIVEYAAREEREGETHADDTPSDANTAAEASIPAGAPGPVGGVSGD